MTDDIVRFISATDTERWPRQLDDLVRTQYGIVEKGLWVRGSADLPKIVQKSVAVVGSRSATTYGTSVAMDLAAELAGDGYTIVSGGAFGIDQAAHRGALANGGLTVAVLAGGVDRAYPSAHRDLLDKIAEDGLVISEQPPGTAPTRERFLARNRIIAALTRATVVVEAAARSGAMSTVNRALALDRPVGAVPGPITSACSEGCHDLIKSGQARLITNSQDIEEMIR